MKKAFLTLIALVILTITTEAKPNFRKNHRQNHRAQQRMMWRHQPQPMLIYSNQWDAPKQPFGWDTRKFMKKKVKHILKP